jgi:hypothetical protein
MVSLPSRGNKLAQKEWSFDRERSFPAHMCSNSGPIPLLSQVRERPGSHSMLRSAQACLGILPRGLHRRGGTVVVAANDAA